MVEKDACSVIVRFDANPSIWEDFMLLVEFMVHSNAWISVEIVYNLVMYKLGGNVRCGGIPNYIFSSFRRSQ